MEKLGKRHVAVVEFYVYGESQEAFDEAKKVCDQLNDQNDCQAVVTELYEQKQGTLTSKKIDIKKLK